MDMHDTSHNWDDAIFFSYDTIVNVRQVFRISARTEKISNNT